jgi:soluble lytic murein transglycosylase-like protein
MMARRLFIIGLLCIGWLPVRAEMLRHRNTDGRWLLTNIPAAVPQLIRKSTSPLPSQFDGIASERPLRQLIYHLARQHDIEPRLVQAIIAVESNYNPQAVSRAGAQGLMQLMPHTAARYRVTNPFDPSANVEGGIRYLKDLLRLFPGDLRRVLAAYNAGENAVLQYGGIPPYPETQQYVARVLALYGTAELARKIYRYRTANGSILFTDTPQ